MVIVMRLLVMRPSNDASDKTVIGTLNLYKFDRGVRIILGVRMDRASHRGVAWESCKKKCSVLFSDFVVLMIVKVGLTLRLYVYVIGQAAGLCRCRICFGVDVRILSVDGSVGGSKGAGFVGRGNVDGAVLRFAWGRCED